MPDEPSLLPHHAIFHLACCSATSSSRPSLPVHLCRLILSVELPLCATTACSAFAVLLLQQHAQLSSPLPHSTATSRMPIISFLSCILLMMPPPLHTHTYMMHSLLLGWHGSPCAKCHGQEPLHYLHGCASAPSTSAPSLPAPILPRPPSTFLSFYPRMDDMYASWIIRHLVLLMLTAGHLTHAQSHESSCFNTHHMSTCQTNSTICVHTFMCRYLQSFLH